MLASLQNEVENFILKMAAEFPPRKDQLIFLINNYDMMLAVLMVSCYNILECLKYVSEIKSRHSYYISNSFYLVTISHYY